MCPRRVDATGAWDEMLLGGVIEEREGPVGVCETPPLQGGDRVY